MGATSFVKVGVFTGSAAVATPAHNAAAANDAAPDLNPRPAIAHSFRVSRAQKFSEKGNTEPATVAREASAERSQPKGLRHNRLGGGASFSRAIAYALKREALAERARGSLVRVGGFVRVIRAAHQRP